MLRINRMGGWSVAYYESTAVRGHECGGGLAEYYSERDTRAPQMVVVGDAVHARDAMGVEHGGAISADEVSGWFGSGRAPGGVHRVSRRPGTQGWDLTFAAPKSVSVLAALGDDPWVVVDAFERGVDEAMRYVHRHAGYTRVHNRVTGMKDLVRLPSLAAVKYVHHTARPAGDGTCDPHLHAHVLVPGKIARADGAMVAIDSQSMYHEARAAGLLFQSVLRDVLSAELGVVWGPVDRRTGVAEIEGFTDEMSRWWSRRRAELMAWAQGNVPGGVEVLSPQWLEVAQKQTRTVKSAEVASHADMRGLWQAREDAARVRLVIDHAKAARQVRQARTPGAGEVFEWLVSGESTFTRADVVEAFLAARPVLADGRYVDAVSVDEQVDRLLADAGVIDAVAGRAAHEREGHIRWSHTEILAQEKSVWERAARHESHLSCATREVNPKVGDFVLAGLDQGRAEAFHALFHSENLVNVLEGPAGTAKTSGLAVFADYCGAAGSDVVVLSTQHSAITADRDAGAGHQFATVASALLGIERGSNRWGRETVVVVDEAAMVGNAELGRLIARADERGSKVLLCGDSAQMQPILAAGGLFRDLSEQLAWTQRLDRVFRQTDAAEAAATLAVRNARNVADAVKAASWYSEHGRLHAGDLTEMAQGFVEAYVKAHQAGKSVVGMADQWEHVDALNIRIQAVLAELDPHVEVVSERVAISRDQAVRIGDIVRTNTADRGIGVYRDPRDGGQGRGVGHVAKGDRWTVIGVNAAGDIDVKRLGDGAYASLGRQYALKHAMLGYVGTRQSVQGLTADTGLWFTNPDRAGRSAVYVAITRGRGDNQVFIACGGSERAESHGQQVEHDQVFTARDVRGFMAAMIDRDDMAYTAREVAERHRGQAGVAVGEFIDWQRGHVEALNQAHRQRAERQVRILFHDQWRLRSRQHIANKPFAPEAVWAARPAEELAAREARERDIGRDYATRRVGVKWNVYRERHPKPPHSEALWGFWRDICDESEKKVLLEGWKAETRDLFTERLAQEDNDRQQIMAGDPQYVAVAFKQQFVAAKTAYEQQRNTREREKISTITAAARGGLERREQIALAQARREHAQSTPEHDFQMWAGTQQHYVRDSLEGLYTWWKNQTERHHSTGTVFDHGLTDAVVDYFDNQQHTDLQRAQRFGYVHDRARDIKNKAIQAARLVNKNRTWAYPEHIAKAGPDTRHAFDELVDNNAAEQRRRKHVNERQREQTRDRSAGMER